MGLYGVMECVHIDTLWNLEVIYERPFFSVRKTLQGIYVIEQHLLNFKFLPYLLQALYSLTSNSEGCGYSINTSPILFCLLPVDIGLCSGQLSLTEFFPLQPSSWVIADKAPKLINFWPLSFSVSCSGCKIVSAVSRRTWQAVSRWEGSGCFWSWGSCRRARPKPCVKPRPGLQLGW